MESRSDASSAKGDTHFASEAYEELHKALADIETVNSGDYAAADAIDEEVATNVISSAMAGHQKESDFQ